MGRSLEVRRKSENLPVVSLMIVDLILPQAAKWVLSVLAIRNAAWLCRFIWRFCALAASKVLESKTVVSFCGNGGFFIVTDALATKASGNERRFW